jgi:peptidoglycan/xylan/chitin deacetylase (PgdA/CDA1 family)
MKLRPLVLFLSAVVWLHAVELAPKRIALVFDDGPRPADAEPLLAVLAKENVHVTFSLVGDRVNESPATAKLIAAAGHEIANHSQTHAHPRQLDDAALDREVGAAQDAIIRAVGKAPRWYWPPFIESDPRLNAATAKAGLKIYPINQLVVSLDYEPATPAAEIYRRATTDVRDGAVILFHEWRKETREQMPAIIAELRRQGCFFFTFSALQDSLAEGTGKATPTVWQLHPRLDGDQWGRGALAAFIPGRGRPRSN